MLEISIARLSVRRLKRALKLLGAPQRGRICSPLTMRRTKSVSATRFSISSARCQSAPGPHAHLNGHPATDALRNWLTVLFTSSLGQLVISHMRKLCREAEASLENICRCVEIYGPNTARNTGHCRLARRAVGERRNARHSHAGDRPRLLRPSCPLRHCRRMALRRQR
jgi:hypothetical protein